MNFVLIFYDLVGLVSILIIPYIFIIKAIEKSEGFG